MRLHAPTRAYTCLYASARAYMRLHALVRVYACLYTPPRAYTRLHAPTRVCTRLRAPTCVYTRWYATTLACTRLHAPTATRALTRALTRSRAMVENPGFRPPHMRIYVTGAISTFLYSPDPYIWAYTPNLPGPLNAPLIPYWHCDGALRAGLREWVGWVSGLVGGSVIGPCVLITPSTSPPRGDLSRIR